MLDDISVPNYSNAVSMSSAYGSKHNSLPDYEGCFWAMDWAVRTQQAEQLLSVRSQHGQRMWGILDLHMALC